VRGGDVAAEDDRLEALLSKLRGVLAALSLGSLAGRPALGAWRSVLAASAVFGTGGGFDVVGGQGVVGAVEHALAAWASAPPGCASSDLRCTLSAGSRVRRALTAAAGDDEMQRSSASAAHQFMRCSRSALALGALDQFAGIGQHIVEQLRPRRR
jgi:hypothetical protein